MPTYLVSAPDGRKFKIDGDLPPSESELDDIFNHPATKPPEIFNPESDPIGFTRTLPSQIPLAVDANADQPIDQAISDVGNVARAIPADVAAGYRALSTGPGEAAEFSGNLPAAFTGRELPIDAINRDAALEAGIRGEAPTAATLGKISQGVASTLPMMAMGGLPSVAQKLAMAGFTAKMLQDAPEVATRLGTELGKPESQRNPEELSSALSDAIQTGAFTGLGALGLSGAGRNAALTTGDRMRILNRDFADTFKPRAETSPEAVRALGVDYPPNPFFRPGVGDLAARALQEAQGRAILEPGAEPALATLRREFSEPDIQGSGLNAREDQAGGQVSFAAPAEAGGVPSARQAAIAPVEQVRITGNQLAEHSQFVGEQKTVSDLRKLRNQWEESPDDPRQQHMLELIQNRIEQIQSERGGKLNQAPTRNQSALPFFDRASEAAGLDRPSTAPTVEDVRAQRALEERQNATNDRQQSENSQQQHSGTTLGEDLRPYETQVRGGQGEQAVGGNRANEGGAEPTQPLIDLVSKMDPTQLMDISKSSGGVTKNAYRIAESITAADIPKLEQASKEALKDQAKVHEEVNAAKTLDEKIPMLQRGFSAAMKTQMFKEAARWRLALDDAKSGGAKTISEFAALEKKHGVGSPTPERAGLELMESARRSEMTREKSSPEELQIESVEPLDVKSGSPLSATDALINKLEALKLPETSTAGVGVEQLHSGFDLPHPNEIKAIGKQVWNTAIDTAIAAIKAGKAVKAAIGDAMSYIRKNAKGFDDAKMQRNLDFILNAEKVLGNPQSERSKSASKAATNTEIPKPANGQTGLDTKSVRMRNLSERGTQATSVPEAVQKQLGSSPDSFYYQQSTAKVKAAVKGMTDADLDKVSTESPLYTAAKLEQANRLFTAGKDAEGYQIFSDLSKQLTKLGQVINQAKMLQALNPEHVAKVVNADLKKAGRDPLTERQAADLEVLSRDRIDSQRALDSATERWQQDPSDANQRLAEQALNDSETAALNEQQKVYRYQQRSMSGLLKSILQGNLLTPISEVANLVGNVSFVPFRVATRTLASGLDMIDSAIRNAPRQIESRPITGTSEMVKGMIRGINKIPDVLMRGTGDVIKGESRTGLHPLEAWVKQFASNPDSPTIGGKIPFSDRVKWAIEGTFGVPAEAMLRGLGAGDLPFKMAARSRFIAEAAKLNKIPDAKLNFVQKFPELFFDQETMKRIDSETARDLFQRESETLQHFTSLLGKKGGLVDLAASFVAPYKLTPWNILGEIFSYNPLIAAGKTALEASRGNKRAAETNAAKMVVGGMLIGSGAWLYKKGLLAPSMDQSSETQKARVLAGEVLPPNHINISGLQRALSGGNPSFKSGDITRDVFRAGGLAGSMFYMAANMGRDLERKPVRAGDYGMALLKDSVLEQARFGVNQSFLKGISSILQSITSGEADTTAQSIAGSVLSIPLPNTLSTMARATRNYKVDMKDDDWKKEVANVVKTRLGAVGLDDYLPLKRGLWGEAMLETPKDANALMYHFFDITKGHQVTDDAVPLELYRLWRTTSDSKAIPSLPERSIQSGNQNHPLPADQYSRYAQLVGQARRQIVEKLVVNPEYSKGTDEQKIKWLDNAYNKGLASGKSQFLTEHPLPTLTVKPKPAGFK